MIHPLDSFKKFPPTYASVAIALAAMSAPYARADSYDLATDWSDTTNPNGTWRLYAEGELAVAGVRGGDLFTSPPGAPVIWGNPNVQNFVGWSKSNGSEIPHLGLDLQVGDIYAHSGGTISVNWTSPADGTISIEGGIWALRDIGRANAFSLALDQNLLVASEIFSGDPYDRANPLPLLAQNLAVESGDVLTLTVAQVGGAGDYLGVNLSITLAPTSTRVPDSFSAALVGGLMCGLHLMYQRVRRRNFLS